MPVRQRPVRRGGGGGSGSSSGGGHSQNSFTHPPPPPPPPPPFPIFAMPPNGFSNLVPAMPDQSPREPLYRGNTWEPRPIGGFVPPQPVVSEYRRPRRGNFGQPPGDGSHRNNYAGRREQDRGHHGNARDAHVQQQRAPTRGFPRPSPPNSGTFIPPQSARPFANPMGYTGKLLSLFESKPALFYCGLATMVKLSFRYAIYSTSNNYGTLSGCATHAITNNADAYSPTSTFNATKSDRILFQVSSY